MGTPSRDDPADDGLIDRWLARHETAAQADDDADPGQAAPAPEAIEPVRTPEPRAQPADPLTAPLSELFADPVSGPLLHPLLNVEEPPPAAEEVPPAEVEPEPAPEVEPEPEVAAKTDAEPEVETSASEAADSEAADSDPIERPSTGPDVTDVDTTGFTPSAPLDVFAALRGAGPAQPSVEERRSRLSGMLQRKRPQPSAKAEPTKVEPVQAEPVKAEPVPTAAEPVPASTQITDAAIAGPAMAAVLKAEESGQRQPIKAKTKGPVDPLETLLPKQPEEPPEPTEPTEPTTYVEQTAPEPRFETLDQLLEAVTARTHPPAPLAPDPRRSTAAEVARQFTTEPAVTDTDTDTGTASKADPEQDAQPDQDQKPATWPVRPTDTAISMAPVRPITPKPAEPAPATERPTAAVNPNDTIDLTARRSTQQVLLVLLLIGVLATAALAWIAWQDRSMTSIAFAVAAAVVTFVIWSAHSTAAPPTVLVERGQLDIRTHDSHHRFDLASHYTNVEVEGSPGRRGWKVLIHRTGMPPYKLDATMVDPQQFTDVLDRYRDRS